MIKIYLLNTFTFCIEREMLELSDGQQRLVVALALNNGRLRREDLAEMSVPGPTTRASARLRQMLWRVNKMTAGQLLCTTRNFAALAETVQVDYWVARTLASSLEKNDSDVDFRTYDWEPLQQQLLPGWDIDWLLPLQQAWEVQRMRALERIAETLLRDERHDFAVRVADAAARADPLREKPRRIAIQSCINMGEFADAYRRYDEYGQLVRGELGISPSQEIPLMIQRALKLDRPPRIG
jgi:DNA-binding SARP family transcriptional activator